MKRIRFLYALTGILLSFLPARFALGQSGMLLSVLAGRGANAESARIPEPEDPNIPQEMLDLMRSAQALYLQGSDLLKSGEPARAREYYDRAVELLLQSKWNVASTPDLNGFFQDLIRRIKRDESLYLRPPRLPEDEPEKAVLDDLQNLDLFPIQVDPSLQDAVEADIFSTKYDIPIVLNESVLKSLNFWLNRGRRIFTDGLMRSGRYRDMICETFQAASLPLDLMYLAQVESLFKTNALSRASARGMWQFGRGTGIRYGLKINRSIDERMDPLKSTQAAARYLNDLYAMFGNWNLVLAAYNWGEGKVQKLIKKHGKDDFWALTGLRRGLPKETKNHVPLILSSVILARNPEKYGLPVDLDPPLRYDTVKIAKRTSLSATAKLLGIEVETLKRLNPALRTAYTPANYPDFELKIPAGLSSVVVEQLASLPAARTAPPATFPGRHRVRAGETLWSIAARYGTTIAALQEANDIESPRSLQIGSLLQVPSANPAPVQTPAGRVQARGSELAKAPPED